MSLVSSSHKGSPLFSIHDTILNKNMNLSITARRNEDVSKNLIREGAQQCCLHDNKLLINDKPLMKSGEVKKKMHKRSNSDLSLHTKRFEVSTEGSSFVDKVSADFTSHITGASSNSGELKLNLNSSRFEKSPLSDNMSDKIIKPRFKSVSNGRSMNNSGKLRKKFVRLAENEEEETEKFLFYLKRLKFLQPANLDHKLIEKMSNPVLKKVPSIKIQRASEVHKLPLINRTDSVVEENFNSKGKKVLFKGILGSFVVDAMRGDNFINRRATQARDLESSKRSVFENYENPIKQIFALNAQTLAKKQKEKELSKKLYDVLQRLEENIQTFISFFGNLKKVSVLLKKMIGTRTNLLKVFFNNENKLVENFDADHFEKNLMIQEQVFDGKDVYFEEKLDLSVIPDLEVLNKMIEDTNQKKNIERINEYELTLGKERNQIRYIENSLTIDPKKNKILKHYEPLGDLNPGRMMFSHISLVEEMERLEKNLGTFEQIPEKTRAVSQSLENIIKNIKITDEEVHDNGLLFCPIKKLKNN